MVMHPVGPLPASTYWRRRLVLALGLVVVLLVLRSCTGGAAPTKVRATPTPTGTRSVSPSPASSPSSPSASPRPVAVPPGCPDPAITLTTSTDAETYAVGGTPKITLQVKNTGTSACRRDLGAGAVELLVFSGTDRVWSSDDCNPSTARAVTALPAGGAQSVVKTWPGTRSLPGCAGSKAPAKAGTYRVVARVGTLRVDGAVFRLRG